jgi:hypothetical protein
MSIAPVLLDESSTILAAFLALLLVYKKLKDEILNKKKVDIVMPTLEYYQRSFELGLEERGIESLTYRELTKHQMEFVESKVEQYTQKLREANKFVVCPCPSYIYEVTCHCVYACKSSIRSWIKENGYEHLPDLTEYVTRRTEDLIVQLLNATRNDRASEINFCRDELYKYLMMIFVESKKLKKEAQDYVELVHSTHREELKKLRDKR